MTYVVTQKCKGCKDLACIRVCPCECFHEGPEMLFINPDSCIDCGACEPECPADAIYHEDDVPSKHLSDIKLNASSVEIYPVILE